MSDFEYSLDFDLSLDLGIDDIIDDLKITDKIEVTKIELEHKESIITLYVTDDVYIAQGFREDTLDLMSEGKVYLLPDGEEIINIDLLIRMNNKGKVEMTKEQIEESLIKDFSNYLIRNHLKYVKKRGGN